MSPAGKLLYEAYFIRVVHEQEMAPGLKYRCEEAYIYGRQKLVAQDLSTGRTCC